VELIIHRQNSIVELNSIEQQYGVEVDVRSNGKALIVSHEPFINGELFEQWLGAFRHRILIVNVKEEGLEEKILPTLETFGIENYFILDESFPYIVKWSRKGLRKFALRVSDIESVMTAHSLSARNLAVDWVWVDCFDQKCPNIKLIEDLRALGHKICLVSPELHVLDDPLQWNALVEEFLSALYLVDPLPDAVCTKLPEIWSSFLESYSGRKGLD